jgi:urease accessory protein
MRFGVFLFFFASVMASRMVFAHTGNDLSGAGFVDGFLHPVTGLDHVVAMVAVGIWGAILKEPAIWILPITFPLAMAFGGALGIRGVPLPYTEIIIAVSGIVLGLFVATYRRTPLAVAAVVVGTFAIFHGHAHGMEAPGTADPIAYCLGFVFATGLLHLSGIGIGVLDRFPAGKVVIRCVGGVIATTGAYFLIGSF